MLCETCLSIFQGTFPPYSYQTHHQTVASLHNAVRDGCWICNKLWEDLTDFYWSYDELSERMSDEEKSVTMIEEIEACQKTMEFSRDAGSLVKYKFAPSHPQNTLEGNQELVFKLNEQFVDVRRKGVPNIASGFCLFFNLDGTNESDTGYPFIPLYSKNNQGYSLNLAKSWLEDCLKNHQKCSINESKWYPTRLLQLNAPQTSMVRLVSTIEQTVNDSYMTLSHCWGKAQLLKLTIETSTALFAGIKTSSLPQTFQDAIEVTLVLGFEYLWIDSLCIFQDSLDDWAHESSMMGNVYLNGICNLAATSSRDSNGGLFSNRSLANQSLSNPCYIESSWTNARNYRWHVYRACHKENDFLCGPLLNRGWVVQERVMALRVLHFGSKQLYWECHSHNACEAYPTGIPPMQFPGTQLLVFKRNCKPFNSTSEARTILDFWTEIVSAFSKCALTMEGDKLVALSGIAKAMQKSSLKCQYLAGIWRFELERNLLWMVSQRSVGIHPKQYRAPSWSWASIDGHIVFFGREVYSSKSPEINILEATIENLGADPIGQVKSGYLKLRGPLMSFSFRRGERHADWWDMELNGKGLYSSSLYSDTNKSCPNLYCMPIQSLAVGPEGSFACLLLESISGIKIGEFRRWGTVIINLRDFGIKQWKNVQNEEWFQAPEPDVDGKYTVVIF